jgi:GGDEF domain-containing protein
LNLEDVAVLISNQTRRIVPASTCAIYAYDPEPDELFCAHAAGENAAQFAGLRILRGQRLTGWVAANKQTILNSDPVLDLGEVARSMRPRLRSCLSTALVSNGELLGVLTLYSPAADAFSDDHRRIIEAVAKQVSPTLRQAIYSKHRRDSKVIDRLAGLPNRQQLRRFIQAEVSMEGVRSPLSVILVSVQTSTSSQPPVDATEERDLWQVVDAIRSVLRDGDILFRFSDYELVVLLTQTDANAALVAVSRIAGRISDSLEPLKRSSSALQGVTFGCASAPTDGMDGEALLNVARRRASGGPTVTTVRPPSIH